MAVIISHLLSLRGDSSTKQSQSRRSFCPCRRSLPSRAQRKSTARASSVSVAWLRDARFYFRSLFVKLPLKPPPCRLSYLILSRLLQACKTFKPTPFRLSQPLAMRSSRQLRTPLALRAAAPVKLLRRSERTSGEVRVDTRLGAASGRTTVGKPLAVSAKPCPLSPGANRRSDERRCMLRVPSGHSRSRQPRYSTMKKAVGNVARQVMRLGSPAARNTTRALAPPSPLPPPNHPPHPPHPSRCLIMAGGSGGIRASCLAPASRCGKPPRAWLGLRALVLPRPKKGSINSLFLGLQLKNYAVR